MDLVETFKFKKGLYKTDPNKMFQYSHTSNLRGHSEKIFKTRSRLDIRKNFFSHRVIKPWNKLPESAVSAKKSKDFKHKLQRCLSSDEEA